MSSSKYNDELYIAVYATGILGQYSYAFHVPRGSGDEVVTKRYRVITGRRGFWEYDEDLLGSEKLKDLIILARTGEIVRSRHDLESALREVPILQGKRQDPRWNTRTWMRDCLAQLARDRVLAIDAVTSWDDIEERTKPIKARHVLNGIVKKKHGVARFDLVTQRALKNC
ncbi:hypothetical protein AAP_01387 [Ascosphaera apis ARSEF 7405]|uniref:Uncharacterized protein n=1 Tax=Ascosphaera apis ARSEF 7405 TaxID=392613 RepID=A0A168BT87_9EURO|nr:hypothetical protein AAP_01387 [Ascosphaera apis ARSEF 7405]